MLTEQQKKERSQGIGGSDMPIILGLSPYKTPLMLYLEKKGLMESSYVETEQQDWGNRLERVIRKYFGSRHSVQIIEPDTFIHPVFNYLRGNVDGYIPEWDAILEIKCADKFNRNEWGEDGTDILPLPYLVQVAHYCLVANAKKAIVAVLIGGNEYREFTYYRDQEIEERILDAAYGFWTAVETDTMPDCINIDDLKLKYSACKQDSFVEVSDEISTYINSLRETKEEIKKLSEHEELYKFKIMEHMKDFEILKDADNRVMATWKKSKKGFRTFLIK